MIGIRTLSSMGTRSGMNYFFAQKGQKSFELAMSEIGVALPLFMALLYKMGQDKAEGSSNVNKKLFSSLGEAGLTQVILEHTKNVYPIIAGSTAIYAAGTAKTKEDKLKALLKPAILFPLGAIAMLTGAGFTDGLRYCGAKRIIALLKDKEILSFMSKSALKSSKILEKELQLPLKNLHDSVVRFAELFKSKTFNKKTFKQSLKAMEESQSLLLNKIKSDKSPITLLDKNTLDVLSKLAKEIKHNQSYGLLRLLNPCFAYILAVSLAGPVLVKKASDFIFQNESKNDLDANSNSDPLPLWFDRIAGIYRKKTSLGEHYHPLLRADGPALLQGSWEGDF